MDESQLLGRDGNAGDLELSPKGEDLLPPVEAPSGSFIIQLFVVPALIVLVIVGVSLTFRWLVRRTASQPQEVIAGLEQGPAIARWQRASELADMLRNERFADFKRNKESAAHLARILEREIEAGGMEDGEIAMRVYLAKALGQFEVNEGIDTLLKAAETNRDEAEQLVRYRAIEAIAERAYLLNQLKPPAQLTHPQLEPSLLKLAGDENPFVRGRTVYALGQLGTPAAIERLEVMVDDPDPDTRYDAAVALAHRGNDKGVATLAEMLDLEEVPAALSKPKEGEQSDPFKRAVVVASAIEAVKDLAKKNPQANLGPVEEALQALASAAHEKFAKANVPTRAALDAERALDFLKEQQSAGAH
jgi:HEAT repeat protein